MNKSGDKALRQYLDRYAEPEAATAAGLRMDYYRNCIVIPARAENWSDINAALAAIEERFLFILVVNAPTADATTLDLLDDARHQGECIARARNVEYVKTRHSFDLLLVDRCTPSHTIDPHQGVGLARKVGADVALALMKGHALEPGLIYCTDADVRLPRDYFQSSDQPPEIAALLFPFVHETVPALATATMLYEIAMLYYAAGLSYAGSPYAFPVLGSCLAVSMDHYARVRGFPRRSAAEDFYLLNKLAKTGRIRSLSSPVIRVAGRRSERVPFGTGVGIARIAGLDDPLRDYRFYHPRIFDLLRQWLGLLPATWRDRGVPRTVTDMPEIAAWISARDVGDVIARSLAHRRSPAAFTKAMHDWFDAGRTLRFVHFMRDNFLPSVPISALTGAGFLDLPHDHAPPPAVVRKQLLARLYDRRDKTV